MSNKITLEWFYAAGIRALKTVAQTALAMFTVGQALSDISWETVVSVSLVAGLYSILTSIKGLPEVGTDGTLLIDTSDPNKDIWRLSLDNDLDVIAGKSSIKLNVNPNADLSQK